MLDPAGDRYVKGEDGYQLIQVARTPARSEAMFLFKSQFSPPDIVINLMHSFVNQLAIAWHHSQDDA